MGQRLRVHTDLGEEPCLDTIRCLITTCNSSSRGSVQGILDSMGTCTHVHMWCTETYLGTDICNQ